MPRRHDFNPRSLAGATCRLCQADHGVIFQSTLPCGSDLANADELLTSAISIHAPLRERLAIQIIIEIMAAFQSTLPCGSDIVSDTVVKYLLEFQSTLPCGSDLDNEATFLNNMISIHAPLRERRAHWSSRCIWSRFQSTLPCGSDRLTSTPSCPT